MKRNLFWLVMGGLAVGWVFGTKHYCGQPRYQQTYMALEGSSADAEARLRRHLKVLEATSQHPPGFVVVHENGGTIVKGPDDRIVSIHNPEDADADDLESVDGLPVPVVRGTRTTEATAEPPKPSATPKRPRQPKRPPAPSVPKSAANETLVTVTGLRSATAERARASVRQQFERTLVDDVLKDALPRGWKVPEPLLDRMIREVKVAPIVRDYGTVYEATLKADLSPRHRDEVIRAYRQQEVRKRMLFLGVVLAIVLIGLAVVSGYIRADEATKGYYTGRLRTVALAVLGAGAVALYQWYARS